MTVRPRKSKPQPKRHADTDLVFREFRALVVQKTRIEAASTRPGMESQMVSFRVFGQMGGHEAELMVRIVPERGSYACWTVQQSDSAQFRILNTFDAYKA
jgi:hypothetical protein